MTGHKRSESAESSQEEKKILLKRISSGDIFRINKGSHPSALLHEGILLQHQLHSCSKVSIPQLAPNFLKLSPKWGMVMKSFSRMRISRGTPLEQGFFGRMV